MKYLVKDEELELKYEAGKGAWTYHIQVPNTKHIVGKWGSLKVSGTIDNYTIDSINLFTIGGQDKLISINEKIRKAIKKSGGDTVTVTLYLLISKEEITENEIIETFKESGVLKTFEKYAELLYPTVYAISYIFMDLFFKRSLSSFILTFIR